MPEKVIVDWLTATGDYHSGAQMSYNEAIKVSEAQEFAYVGDEFLHEIRGHKPLRNRQGQEVSKLPLLEIPPMPRALLWFIQDNVGEMFSLSLAAHFFKISCPGKQHRGADNRFLQYKTRLGKYLPDGLISRMLPRSHQRLICIPKGGWSFCWIHRPNAPSDLLLGAKVDLHYRHTDAPSPV